MTDGADGTIVSLRPLTVPSVRAWRTRAAVGITLRLCVFVVAGYVLYRRAPATVSDVVLVALVVVLPVRLFALWTVAHYRALRRMQGKPHRVVREDWRVEPYGLSVTIIQGLDRGEAGRCYRHGRQVWIIMRPFSGNSDVNRFVLQHELAHAIRNDPSRYRLTSAVNFALILAALVTSDPGLIIATVAGVVLGSSASRWIAEIAADRIAVAETGTRGIASFAAAAAAARRRPENLTLRRRLRRLKGWMTHPPTSWRPGLAGGDDVVVVNATTIG
ncbi:MAG TPA: M48 family metalloprotease [Micromonosporaceae bacterium]